MKKISAFIKKYNAVSPAVKASFWFVICSILQRGISVITTPIFTRMLTTEEYGLFTVYTSWYTIFRVFATLSLDAGVFNNAMIKYKNDRDGYTTASLGLSTTCSLVFSIIIIFISTVFSDFTNLPPILLYFMSMELIFNAATALFTSRKRFDYDFRDIVFITLLVSVLSPIIGYIAVITTIEYKAQARIISYVLIQVIAGIYLSIRIIARNHRLIRLDYWKYALNFNIPLIPHYLSMMILGQSDRIMIGELCSNASAAIYGIAYMISQLMIIITDAIGNSFTPFTYRAIDEGQYSKVRHISNTLFVLVGAGVIVVMCVGPEIIKILATEEYYDARWVIPPVSLSVYFIFLYPMFSNVELYFGKRLYVMIGSVVGAGMNILLNYLYIPVFGYIAAGYTTLFCYGMFVFIHYIIYKQLVKSKLKNVDLFDCRFILIYTIFLIVITAAMLFLYDRIIVRYCVLMVIICFFVYKRKWFIDRIKDIRRKV